MWICLFFIQCDLRKYDFNNIIYTDEKVIVTGDIYRTLVISNSVSVNENFFYIIILIYHNINIIINILSCILFTILFLLFGVPLALCRKMASYSVLFLTFSFYVFGGAWELGRN